MSSHTHGNKNRSALRFLTSQNFVNGSCQTAWPIECQQWCWPIKTALTSSMADAFGVLLTAFLQTVTFIWVQLITASLDLISLEDFLWYNWSHMQHWSSHPSSYCRLHLAPGVFHYSYDHMMTRPHGEGVFLISACFLQAVAAVWKSHIYSTSQYKMPNYEGTRIQCSSEVTFSGDSDSLSVEV